MSIIGVLGSKGGVGATTLAVNLSTALSLVSKSGSVVLVDANLQQPDVALMLAAKTDYSLMDLVQRPAIERKVFEACSIPVADSNDLRILSAPLDGSAQGRINLTEVARCLPQLANFADLIVVDLPKHLDRHLVTTLDACDFIVLVAEATVASIAATRRLIAICAELGYPQEKILVVANRCGGKLKFVEQQLFMSFDGMPVFALPNVYLLNETCAIEGVPMVIKHAKDKYSKSVKTFALQLQMLTAKMSAATVS